MPSTQNHFCYYFFIKYLGHLIYASHDASSDIVKSCLQKINSPGLSVHAFALLPFPLTNCRIPELTRGPPTWDRWILKKLKYVVAFL